ncbi:MAG: hypothetical protein CH6_0487 [Candidatus Kapaibacterium sp.]|nr:MAG: hypothetical protein CH6_0487 [Candidatus Kapabacteria bacterium]
MKKVIFVIVIVFLFSFAFASEALSWYKRTTIGGRDNGPGKEPTYNYVSIERTDKYTNIWCEGSGPNPCPYAVVGPGRDPTPKTDAEQNCVDYALSQISQGVLSGNWTDPVTQHYVEWEKVGVNINIKVKGPGESLPE